MYSIQGPLQVQACKWQLRPIGHDPAAFTDQGSVDQKKKKRPGFYIEEIKTIKRRKRKIASPSKFNSRIFNFDFSTCLLPQHWSTCLVPNSKWFVLSSYIVDLLLWHFFRIEIFVKIECIYPPSDILELKRLVHLFRIQISLCTSCVVYFRLHWRKLGI